MAPRVREIREYQRIRTVGAKGGKEEKRERERERERERLGKARAYYRMHICRHMHFRALDPRERRLFASRHLLAKPAGLFTYLLPCSPCVPVSSSSRGPISASLVVFSLLSSSSSSSFSPSSFFLFRILFLVPPRSWGKFLRFIGIPSWRALKFQNSIEMGREEEKNRRDETSHRWFLGYLRVVILSYFSCWTGWWNFVRET